MSSPSTTITPAVGDKRPREVNPATASISTPAPTAASSSATAATIVPPSSREAEIALQTSADFVAKIFAASYMDPMRMLGRLGFSAPKSKSAAKPRPMIQILIFQRLIRNLLSTFRISDLRVQANALAAIHEALQAHLNNCCEEKFPSTSDSNSSSTSDPSPTRELIYQEVHPLILPFLTDLMTGTIAECEKARSLTITAMRVVWTLREMYKKKKNTTAAVAAVATMNADEQSTSTAATTAAAAAVSATDESPAKRSRIEESKEKDAIFQAALREWSTKRSTTTTTTTALASATNDTPQATTDDHIAAVNLK